MEHNCALRMARGTLKRIEDGEGLIVRVLEGEVHITQERDRRDYFVPAGRTFILDRPGLALVFAIRPSALTVTPLE